MYLVGTEYLYFVLIFTAQEILLQEASELFQKLMKKEITAYEIESLPVLEKIKSSVSSYRDQLVQSSRTAALWIQYMDMVDILRFITAERTANWSLHLHVLDEMLPYLAASGHNLYTKCVHLYLESMVNYHKNNHSCTKSSCQVYTWCEEAIGIGQDYQLTSL